jgi:hypothetical protein
VKRFVDEEDDSYESSTEDEDESEHSVGGGNESDGDPYADGTHLIRAPFERHINQSVPVFSISFIPFCFGLVLI